MKLTSFFKKKLAFAPIDPLGDGLGDDIAEEQNEVEAIRLDSDEDVDIGQFWRAVEDDLHSGGALDFSKD